MNVAHIRQAVEHLKQGRTVVIPTETVYGLGADASNPEAVRRIFAIKGRPPVIPSSSISKRSIAWSPGRKRSLRSPSVWRNASGRVR